MSFKTFTVSLRYSLVKRVVEAIYIGYIGVNLKVRRCPDPLILLTRSQAWMSDLEFKAVVQNSEVIKKGRMNEKKT